MKFNYKDIFKTWYEPLERYGCISEIDEKIIPFLLNYRNFYPESNNIFRAFKECSYDETRVVLLGQDPYHNVYEGKPSACGLSFATENGYTNPSLNFILTELGETDHERLLNWPSQGVLMLNTALTVKKHNANSHKNLWSDFSNKLIKNLAQEREHIIWLLLGNQAKTYSKYIKDENIVSANHPASEIYKPKDSEKILFVGSGVFDKVNKKLKEKHIQW